MMPSLVSGPAGCPCGAPKLRRADCGEREEHVFPSEGDDSKGTLNSAVWLFRFSLSRWLSVSHLSCLLLLAGTSVGVTLHWCCLLWWHRDLHAPPAAGMAGRSRALLLESSSDEVEDQRGLRPGHKLSQAAHHRAFPALVLAVRKKGGGMGPFFRGPFFRVQLEAIATAA